MLSGILGFIHLLIAVWAIWQVFKSNAGTGSKILWTLAIFFFPVVGLIAWFIWGPRG